MANSLNTITVNDVTYDAAEYAKEHTTVKANDDLGKDAFLQLLVAQMKYQDPLDPQDNSEYVAELANFSALEQMTNVSKNIESLSAIVEGISSAVASNTAGLSDLSILVNNIDSSLLVGQLSSMIGKNIDWSAIAKDESGNIVMNPSTGSAYRQNFEGGIIESITITDGVPKVVVKLANRSYEVSIGDISKVYSVSDNE